MPGFATRFERCQCQEWVSKGITPGRNNANGRIGEQVSSKLVPVVLNRNVFGVVLPSIIQQSVMYRLPATHECVMGLAHDAHGIVVESQIGIILNRIVEIGWTHVNLTEQLPLRGCIDAHSTR